VLSRAAAAHAIRVERNHPDMRERLSERLRLKVGVDPTDAARRLRALAVEVGNVTSVAGGPEAIIVARDAYLQWVEQAESCLASLTHDREQIAELYTSHYWRIRGLEWNDASGLNDPRPFRLFYSEAAYQASRLERLVDDLEERSRRLSLPDGTIAVLDTNVLLHYQPLTQIPWVDLLGSTHVRLVIPLRVIEEIDLKKYAKNAGLAKRARKLLPDLEHLLADVGGQVAAGVTVLVPVDTGRRERPDDADEEVLTVCRDLQQFSRRSVTLVTGDTGMRLRAEAHGIGTFKLGQGYLRVQDTSAAD
jgi:rRNA-processing protein FCF1